MCSAQVGAASRGRITLGDESGELTQSRLDVFRSPGPQRGGHLLEVSAHCGAHPLGHLGPLCSADVCFGADSFTGQFVDHPRVEQGRFQTEDRGGQGAVRVVSVTVCGGE